MKVKFLGGLGLLALVLTGCQSYPEAANLTPLPQYPTQLPSYAAVRPIYLYNFPDSYHRAISEQLSKVRGRVWRNRAYATPQERADGGNVLEFCGLHQRFSNLQGGQMVRDTLLLVAVYKPDQVDDQGKIVQAPRRYFSIWCRQKQAGEAHFSNDPNHYFAEPTDLLTHNLLSCPEIFRALGQ